MITMVKKILSDGSECTKCREVTDLLEKKKLLNRIDKIVYADPRKPDCEGMKLVRLWGIKRAPFFLVEEKGRSVIYSSVMELIQKELQKS